MHCNNVHSGTLQPADCSPAIAVIDFFLRNVAQHWLPMLFNGLDKPTFVPSIEDLDTANTWFLGSTRVYHPIGISIGSAVFAGLTNVTNRHTDRHTYHATPSVAIGRILCTECIRCGLITQYKYMHIIIWIKITTNCYRRSQVRYSVHYKRAKYATDMVWPLL